ncbi:MAG TPA: DUF5819 family protein [Actinocrinis sp.]|nr:DUF5819 family protein [Actinocrinis sp.]
MFTAGMVTVHLLMTFLYNAPPNPVSSRYAAQIDWWMSPLFYQDWHLFAPEPSTSNVDVQVRARLASGGTVSQWIDLSAQDQAATTGDLIPSHVTVNGLRTAYTEYTSTHSQYSESASSLGPIAQQYLENLVVDRIQGQVGGKIAAVQLRFTTALVPGPRRTAKETAPHTETLIWWTV